MQLEIIDALRRIPKDLHPGGPCGGGQLAVEGGQRRGAAHGQFQISCVVSAERVYTSKFQDTRLP